MPKTLEKSIFKIFQKISNTLFILNKKCLYSRNLLTKSTKNQNKQEKLSLKMCEKMILFITNGKIMKIGIILNKNPFLQIGIILNKNLFLQIGIILNKNLVLQIETKNCLVRLTQMKCFIKKLPLYLPNKKIFCLLK